MLADENRIRFVRASAKVDALLSMVSLPGSAGNCGCACWGDVERSYDGAIADEFCYRGMR